MEDRWPLRESQMYKYFESRPFLLSLNNPRACHSKSGVLSYVQSTFRPTDGIDLCSFLQGPEAVTHKIFDSTTMVLVITSFKDGKNPRKNRPPDRPTAKKQCN